MMYNTPEIALILIIMHNDGSKHDHSSKHDHRTIDKMIGDDDFS